MLKTGNDMCPLPVNLARLIWNAQKLFKCGPAQTIGGAAAVCFAILPGDGPEQ